MPRQRSAGRAPSRPTVPARAAPTQQQTRPASTYAPAQTAQAPAASAPTASQGPGLFGQMASTAAGVAVGSTIGHALGGLFGGSSAPAEAAPQQANMANNQNQYSTNCAGAAENFTKCMDDNSGNMQICNWYLEQLKACQQAAKQ
ncbi:hypothetical protein GGS24DRAFT_90788 [Hypoxylon argillaceum]|nr:hypothetical protein GGS24DRAFT_90788 [Hypoxylon argillaceum]